ncbi:NFX1-type zinc finger-containing protein 1-like [Planococcus citri]|uniref:NFX1-type zinc finger-containing protein 1-like n=1 Tax=Planococcus citri TaxID=170843 RepID=UPI0031F81410
MCQFDFEGFRQELLVQIPEKVNNTSNRKGCSELKSLLIAGESFINIAERLNDNFSRITKEELRAKVMIKVNRILQSFKAKCATLKEYEVEFLDSELQRLDRYMHLYIIQCTPKFIETNWGNSVDFKSAVTLLERIDFSKDVDQIIEQILKRFDQLQVGLTVREKDSIREALQRDLGHGMQQGHWYSCHCGYVYTVANCGMFNQSSSCPNCKAVIGRGSSNAHIQSNYWHTVSRN